MDNLSTTLLITFLPVLIVVAFYISMRGSKRRDLMFLLGFLSVTLFFIYSPDPFVTQKLYVAEGDAMTAIYFSAISSIFLLIAIFVFRRHMGDGRG